MLDLRVLMEIRAKYLPLILSERLHLAFLLYEKKLRVHLLTTLTINNSDSLCRTGFCCR